MSWDETEKQSLMEKYTGALEQSASLTAFELSLVLQPDFLRLYKVILHLLIK